MALTPAGCVSDDAGNGDGSGGDSGESGSETGTMMGTPEQLVDEIIIESNHPSSDSLTATGVGMSNAIKLAAMRENEEGDIESLDGAEVTVIEGDNQSAQELDGQVSKKLLSEGVDVLTGCCSSPVMTAATQVVERQGVPFVISATAADNILQGRDFNYAYRPRPPARRLTSNYADLVLSVIHDGSGTTDMAGLFYINNSHGQATRDSLHKFLPRQNVEIVKEAATEFGTLNANMQVSRFRNAGPDTIIVTTYVASGVLLVQALQDQDYRPPYLTASTPMTLTDDDAVSDIGEFTGGVLDDNYVPSPTVDKIVGVRSQLLDNYDQEFLTSAGMFYTAVGVITQAVEEAGNINPDDINEALMGFSYKDHVSAMGAIKFDDQGENISALGPVSQVQDLSIRMVCPEEYTEAGPQI